MNTRERIKITALLHHFRGWMRGDPALDARELSAVFGVDEFVVRRLGESEGVHFADEFGVPAPIYDNDDTAPIRIAV